MHHATRAHAGGGWTPIGRVCAATTNAECLKAAPGQVGWWSLGNIGTDPVWLKLYDKATTPDVGTDVPVLTILIPGNAKGSGNNLIPSPGVQFSFGIGIAVTAGIEPDDATAVNADEVVINLGIK